MLLLLSKTCAMSVFEVHPHEPRMAKKSLNQINFCGCHFEGGFYQFIDLSIYIFKIKVKSLLNVCISSLRSQLVLALHFSSFPELLLY
jgi:hypothetical protein